MNRQPNCHYWLEIDDGQGKADTGEIMRYQKHSIAKEKYKAHCEGHLEWKFECILIIVYINEKIALEYENN